MNPEAGDESLNWVHDSIRKPGIFDKELALASSMLQLGGNSELERLNEVAECAIKAFPKSSIIAKAATLSWLKSGQQERIIRLLAEQNSKGGSDSIPFLQQLSKQWQMSGDSEAGRSQFSLESDNYLDSSVVSIAGSFNDWKAGEIFLKKSPRGWSVSLDLAPGEYMYKFIVDGKWVPDPGNPNSADDGNGNSNSVIQVQ